MSTMTPEEIRLGPRRFGSWWTAPPPAARLPCSSSMCPASARLPVAHSHDAYEETIYGLRGVTSWTVEGEVVDIGPGDAIVIPRGAVHRFDNNGDEDATMLAIVTPAVLGPEYFHELAAVVEAAAGGPPDPKEIVAVMLRHGLTPAP